MKKNSMIGVVVAGLLALASANAAAQDTGQAKPRQSGQYSKATQSPQSMTGSSALRASSIIGLPVRTASGEQLGTVGDLIVNLNAHSTPFAIVDYGGTLGLGEKHVAVPTSDLKWSSEPKGLILTATKAQFDSASSTPTGGWTRFVDRDWAKNVDQFYGQPPS